jgi:lysophospholipase L1-like esterase
MRLNRTLAAAATAATLISAMLGARPAMATVALPSSMASTGDSITRAFDLDWNHVLQDDPAESWSTGTDCAGVNSQYCRILRANSGISGHVYNDAKTGANMSALDGQLKTAAGQAVQYVTVAMGANDVCTSSVSTMTPTATFQSEAQQALTDFFAADPGAHIALSSIPDIYQLWLDGQNNSSAQFAWHYYGICQSMLSTSDTAAQRQAVVAQEQADNNALATVCAGFAGCLWDGLAVYNFKFPASDLSTVDYFHPNITGQNAAASVSWSAGYWPTTA